MTSQPFWSRLRLEEMNEEQWESLCDGCGRCCLNKLRAMPSGEVLYTDVACRLLDLQSCRCSDYKRRQKKVPDCIRLTPAMLKQIDWLPPSCAYVLVAQRKPLPAWHPLVCGNNEQVHASGASIRGKAIGERDAGALEDHITDWPKQMPGSIFG